MICESLIWTTQDIADELDKRCWLGNKHNKVVYFNFWIIAFLFQKKIVFRKNHCQTLHLRVPFSVSEKRDSHLVLFTLSDRYLDNLASLKLHPSFSFTQRKVFKKLNINQWQPQNFHAIHLPSHRQSANSSLLMSQSLLSPESTTAWATHVHVLGSYLFSCDACLRLHVSSL